MRSWIDIPKPQKQLMVFYQYIVGFQTARESLRFKQIDVTRDRFSQLLLKFIKWRELHKN